MATIPLVLRPFAVPTYVSVEMPPGRKEDGPKPLPTFPLTQLPPEVLDQLCNQFRANVFAQAEQHDPKAPHPNTELRTVIEDLMKK